MSLCPKCGVPFEEGAKFCMNCGERMPEGKTCRSCGAPLSDDMMFCQECGTPVNAPASTPVPEEPVVPAWQPPEIPDAPVADPWEPTQVASAPEEDSWQPPVEPAEDSWQPPVEPAEDSWQPPVEEAPVSMAEPKEKKPFPMKAVLYGGIAVAVVAVVALLIILLSGASKSQNFALYIKDGEMSYADLSKDTPIQLTDRLVSADEELDNSDFVQAGTVLGFLITGSEDGDLMFYPDRLGDSDEGVSLYCRNITKPGKEATKIDSDVLFYYVSEDANLVTYIKGEEANLYRYNIKKEEKEKLASEVMDFTVSEDGKTVIYSNSENSIYRWVAGKDKEKLASEIDQIVYVSEDLERVYYLRENALYLLEQGKDKEKLASDVSRVLQVYESGVIYYLKQNNGGEVKLMSYINDDLASSDAAMTEPVMPEDPYWHQSDYSSQEAYDKAVEQYEKDYEAYEIAQEEYWAKQDRDSLREEMKNYTMSISTATLCYFDGKEEIVVTEDYLNSGFGLTVAAKPVVAYMSGKGDVKIKMSELQDVYSAWTVESMVEEKLTKGTGLNVAVNGMAYEIDALEPTSFRVSADGELLYYIDEMPEGENYGDLFSVKITDKGVEQPEIYDTEVYAYNITLTDKGEPIYFKEVKTDEGELFMAKKCLDYDVSVNYVYYAKETGDVVYMVDWNESNNLGTLKISSKGKAQKIRDDVYNVQVLPNGKVLYLYDYSTTYYRGDLYVYEKGKSEKIDIDVSAMIPYYADMDLKRSLLNMFL